MKLAALRVRPNPITHHFVNAGLPALAGSFQGCEHVGVEADGGGHFERRFLRAARPAAFG